MRHDSGMFMLSLNNKLITQALFVVNYEKDSAIRTKQFDIERAFESLITGSSVNTNLPDDFNPQAPRVTLTHDKTSIVFSQIAAQLTIDVDNLKDQPIESIIISIDKRIKLFQKCLDKIIPNTSQKDRGLVINVNFPIYDLGDEEIANYIQSNFFKPLSLGVPASAGFNVGFKTEDNFFITLFVGIYKIIDPPTYKENQWIDILNLPIKESGIELKIDVNSRPKVEQPSEITDLILNKAFDFIKNEADTFIGIKK